MSGLADRKLGLRVTQVLRRAALRSEAAFVPVEARQVASMHASEAAAVTRAVDRRKAQFASGRVAARQCMVDLGLRTEAIDVGTQREPLWPNGVVGSISHTNEWAVAWLGRSTHWAGLGVDLEAAERLPENTWPIIFDESEIRALRESDNAQLLATVGFSVKESIYKAIFPTVQRFVDFKEVFLTFGAGHGEVEAALNDQLSDELGNRRLLLGFCVFEELVTSWAVLTV